MATEGAPENTPASTSAQAQAPAPTSISPKTTTAPTPSTAAPSTAAAADKPEAESTPTATSSQDTAMHPPPPQPAPPQPIAFPSPYQQHPTSAYHYHLKPEDSQALNLEHPPGYHQNPAIAHATFGAGGNNAHFGLKQVWDPAPGEAGGRYVYDYSGNNGLNGRAQDSEDEWGLNAAWESTVSWLKGAGERMAQAEEDIWKWMNERVR